MASAPANDVDSSLRRMRDLMGQIDNLRRGRRPMTAEEIRLRDQQRKKSVREAQREVVIPPCADPERRAVLEANTEAWLMWYFSHKFWHPFTSVGKEMIAGIEQTLVYSTDQCIAGPRGEGKSVIAECVTLKSVMTGHLTFGLIFGANGSKALERLTNIKAELESNDLLAVDYPEVCAPIRALEGLPNRANGQLVNGKLDDGTEFKNVRTQMRWAGELIRFPTVPGSKCSGAVIACYGLDMAVRGTNLRGMRPTHALIDDADTEETSNNEEQAAKLEKRIDQAIAGLAPQGRRIGRVMLCTIPSKKSVAWKFSDPQQKPSWNGKRYKLVDRWPDHPERWEEYMSMRSDDQRRGDSFGRRAHAYYLENWNEMNAGVDVTNPYRFDKKLVPDGSQMELSTIQFVYNEIARTSREAFCAEYQNEIIDDLIEDSVYLTSAHVQKRVSGFSKGVVPTDCTLVTQGVDIGKLWMHYAVRAWTPDGTGYTIDYEVMKTEGTTRDSDEGVDEAIERCLAERRDYMAANPYKREDGSPVDVTMTLVDARYKPDTVFKFCREAGPHWMPAMGCGKSQGCVSPGFHAPVMSTRDKRAGNRWFRSRRGRGVWVVMFDSDYWITWEQDHWMRDLSRPGALWLWGTPPSEDDYRRGKLSHDQYGHKTYSMHITAEREVPEVKQGKIVFVWKVIRHQNHFLDGSKLAAVAADLSGINLTGQVAVKQESAATTMEAWFGQAGGA